MKRSFVIFQAEEHLPFHKFLYPINPELALKKKQTKKKLEPPIPAIAISRLLCCSIYLTGKCFF